MKSIRKHTNMYIIYHLTLGDITRQQREKGTAKAEGGGSADERGGGDAICNISRASRRLLTRRAKNRRYSCAQPLIRYHEKYK